MKVKRIIYATLLIIGLLFLMAGVYISVLALKVTSKENKIKGIVIGGTTRSEVEEILGEPPYGNKYSEPITSEKIKEYVNQSLDEERRQGMDCRETETEGIKCDVKPGKNDTFTYREHKEEIQCLENHPNTKFVISYYYRGNPFILEEDNIEIYYNDQNIVCAIERYGLGLSLLK